MTIYIPVPLRSLAGGNKTVEVEGATVAAGFGSITLGDPGQRKHFLVAGIRLRAFVNIDLNDADVRCLPNREASAAIADEAPSIISLLACGTDTAGVGPGDTCRMQV